MNRTLMSGLVVLIASLLLSAPASAAAKCKMKLSIQNNHDSRIKVLKLQGHPSNTPNNRAATEQIRNKIILTGQSWTSSKSHNLLSGTIQGQVDFNGGKLFSAAGQNKYVTLMYRLWVPGDNQWVLKKGIYQRVCRNNKTMSLPVPFNAFGH